MADDLAVEVYEMTKAFPVEERDLRSQMRRGALSVPSNIVEGCARRSARDFLHFVNVAIASASEVRYFCQFTVRVRLLPAEIGRRVKARYDQLIRALQSLLNSLTPAAPPRSRPPRPVRGRPRPVRLPSDLRTEDRGPRTRRPLSSHRGAGRRAKLNPPREKPARGAVC